MSARSPTPDGRRLRAQRNRQKVVTAMLELVRDGNMTPAAEEVAVRANVGLRSVFRYFDDMESLVHEMILLVEAEIHPITDHPFMHTSTEGRLLELIDKRIEFFERAMPFKIVATLKRRKSEKLMECYKRDQQLMEDWLIRALPDEKARDKVAFEALNATLSFEMWHHLRRDRKKTIDESRDILIKTALGLDKVGRRA